MTEGPISLVCPAAELLQLHVCSGHPTFIIPLMSALGWAGGHPPHRVRHADIERLVTKMLLCDSLLPTGQKHFLLYKHNETDFPLSLQFVWKQMSTHTLIQPRGYTRALNTLHSSSYTREKHHCRTKTHVLHLD